MAQKISITLDEEVLAFIDSQTKNRSQLINQGNRIKRIEEKMGK